MQDYLSSANTEFQQRFHQSWSAVGSLKEFGSFHEIYESNPVCSRTSINDISKESINGDAMQGFEAAPKSATISTSPTNENDDRRVSPSQGYQCNINHQQSPTQNSTLSSFVSPGESTLGINLSYAQHAQNQHLSAHLSANTHYLFPTVLGELRQEVNIRWRARQEGMNASAYDNNVQLDYAETPFDGLPADMQNFETQNEAQTHGLWSVPNTVMAGQGGFY
jgi:hypothetical protein